MEAGKLRHSVSIESATDTQDQYGEPIKSWSSFAEVWASREDLSGQEAFAAQQVKADITTRFSIRYVEGITATMRVRMGLTLYNIESVADPDGRARTLLLVTSRQG